MQKISSAICIVLLLVNIALAQASDGTSDPILFTPMSQGCIKQVSASGELVKARLSKEGLEVAVFEGSGDYPGITIIPQAGASAWDLSSCGYMEAKIQNTSHATVKVVARIDDDGNWKDNPWNAESQEIKPGEISTIKVIFGKSFGYQPGHDLKSQTIKQILIFTGKVDAACSFRVLEVKAGGKPNEKMIDPAKARLRPEGGVLWPSKNVNGLKQFQAFDGAEYAWDGKGLQMTFAGGKFNSVIFKPGIGFWNVSDYNEFKVRVKNIGTVPVIPSVCFESQRKPSRVFSSKVVLQPNDETEIIVSFAPSPIWVGSSTLENSMVKKQEGTGSDFDNTRVSGVRIISDSSEGAKKLQLVSILGANRMMEVSNWLGKRPPVEGDWAKTFDDEFDDDRVDLKKWNIYTANYWDKKAHFSKNNIMVRNGKLILHFEKKTGFQNDNPNDTQTGRTSYATGVADTYGKWTQRYGYFETRLKLPKASGIWSAFWLMPDRGIDFGDQALRGDTGHGGMEFDIVEHLSVYGGSRYNIAMHWDGYGKDHKTSGSDCVYILPDRDGYVTCGLLWTPNSAVYYANGREVLRWESPYISSVPSYIIFDLVSGGWDNEPLDDSELPEDLIVDYVRVWQRKDLASDSDGFKPNEGGYSAPVKTSK